MSSTEMEILKADHESAKALYFSTKRRLEEAVKDAKKVNTKFNTPNRFITRQLKKSA